MCSLEGAMRQREEKQGQNAGGNTKTHPSPWRGNEHEGKYDPELPSFSSQDVRAMA
jgi:hypothetical protein